MTTQPGSGLVPEFTLGDRLRKARSVTGLNTRDFAAQLGVSHGTVTNAEGDKRAVRKITLNAWALATGVSSRWLETGEGTATPPPEPGVPATPDDALSQLASRKRARQAGAVPNTRYAAA